MSTAPRGRGSGQDAVRKVVEPVVTATGFDLEDLRVEPAGRRRLVRVIVDADGGVSLDDVAVLSRDLSRALDETDVMGATAYALEVSSPGVDRPLIEPRHWRRAVTRLVKAPLTEGGEVTGRVVSADDDGVVLDVAGAHRAFGYGELGRGRAQVEFRSKPAVDDHEVDQVDLSDVDDEDEGGASWTST